MSRQPFIAGVVLMLLSAGWSQGVFALFPEHVEDQRRNYLVAKQAIKSGNYREFNRLLRELDGYILQSHLEYHYLKKGIGAVPHETILAFIEANSRLVLSERLRDEWLQYLARRGEWKTFITHYKNDDGDARLTCYRLSYLLETSDNQLPLMEEIQKVWLNGSRLPSNCNAVFEHWRKAGHMTRDLVWERIQMAMERRRISLANGLAHYLPPSERVWVERWKRMHRNPSGELSRISYPVETPVARMIIKHGIVRLAWRDPEAAMAQWQQLKKTYQFFGEDENYVLRMVGVLAAQSHLPQAVEWLSAVSADAGDETLRLWRIKAALRAGDWKTAGQFLSALTEEEHKDPQWRYWQARILEKTGEADAARDIYTLLAQERNYYGFLAADKVGTGYALQHASVETSAEELAAMLSRPAIQVAQELYEIGELVDARRQWNWMMSRMNKRELQVAAVIARQWGWHDRAIFTANKSGYMDDLDLRFPVIYRDLVEANAKRAGIDAGWIYGVVRQESAFMPDARSSAGALGLMQLMPQTGRQTGRQLKLNIRSNAAILQVENNVLLGTSYLKRVLDRNAGNQTLATASYNAGPHRVKKWLPEDGDMPADVWVESIPYNETRDYVKNVLGYTAIYELRLGGEHTPLRERMPQVEPRK